VTPAHLHKGLLVFYEARAPFGSLVMALLKSSSESMSPLPAWSGEPWVLRFHGKEAAAQATRASPSCHAEQRALACNKVSKTCETKLRRAQMRQYQYIKKPNGRINSSKKMEEMYPGKFNEKNNNSWPKRSAPALVYLISGNTRSARRARCKWDACLLARRLKWPPYKSWRTVRGLKLFLRARCVHALSKRSITPLLHAAVTLTRRLFFRKTR